MQYHKCVEEIMNSHVCFQRVGGWCEPIQSVNSVSFLSRAAEDFNCVGGSGCPVIMAKDLFESWIKVTAKQ